ncbi:acetoacetyl-CoA synthetase [Trichonephila clavata]|uniref:Acetoacetyl-CoA synthetase n=1 Tax=Trichonephila clavata TaxID=2740835 RepID=A0A8X6H1E4_TRICU|nr:acetoacetyl-CoA synthetase [Trichonephila clavata]
MNFIPANGESKNLNQANVESNYVVWNKKVPDTELEKFKKIIEEKYNLKFQTYWDLRLSRYFPIFLILEERNYQD